MKNMKFQTSQRQWTNDSFCKYFIIAEQNYKGASKDTKLAEELLIEICGMFFRDYVKKFNIDVKPI